MQPETQLDLKQQADVSQAPVNRQRLRVTFSRDASLKYIGHLDMARTWQRILRRADLPLAYSEGFNPQPKITFAAALPVGCTSQQEVMDIVLESARDPAEVANRLSRALPAGITVTSIEEVEVHAPALQTQLIATEFDVRVDQPASIAPLADRVREFVEAPEVRRERRGRTYDLRPLVEALSIEQAEPDRVVIHMRLKATPSGTGRPDEVVAALGLDPAIVKIHRTHLIFRRSSDHLS
jgi:radical SAM-linked protein